MRTANPALNDKVFQVEYPATNTMTLSGTVFKTGVLLALAVATASVSWMEVVQGGPLARTYLWGGLIGGLIASIITIWRPTAAPISAPVYAAAEGLFLGA